MGLGEEEGDAKVGQGLLGQIRSAGKVEAQCFERIGSASQAGSSAVAVLGNRNPAGRDDQGHCSRNIDAVLTVTACAAHVNRAFRGRNAFHPGAHGFDSPGDFFRCLAAIGNFDEQGGNFLVRDQPVENSPEQFFGFVQVHAIAFGSSPAIPRKLASISWPCSVAMDSGWNCTP